MPEAYKRPHDPRPHDPRRPVAALDGKPVQLPGDAREPIPAKPGGPAKRGHEYRRNGTADISCAFGPPGNGRRPAVTERRTKPGSASLVKELLDTRRKDAEKVVPVMDNSNTHTPASLYDAFPPEEARRLTEKLEIHHAPEHGSWLDVAEIEPSAAGRRLRERMNGPAEPARHVGAIESDRNAAGGGLDWRLTTDQARIKLKRLYPSIEER